MHIAVFNFAGFSTIELENSARNALVSDFFKSENKKRIKSYCAARYAASALMRMVSVDFIISKDENFGFPILVSRNGERNKGYFLSLSHTGEWVAAALSQSPIGIDIENIARSAENVIQRILSEKEKGEYENLSQTLVVEDQQVAKSLLYWVSKESAAKACGLGMTRGLDIFELEKTVTSSYKVSIPSDAPFILENPYCTPFIVDKHLLSVCTEKDLLGRGFLGRVFRLLDLNGKFEQLY